MIQFNLLPDVKRQFIRLQRLKRIVIIGCGLLVMVSVVIFLLLFLFVEVAQKKHISDLNTNIQSQITQLHNKNNLNKILTIQNQLNTLPQLQAQTPAASRLLPYLAELTPTQASVSTLQADFTQNTISITGSADSLATVNKFVDALKFTTYTSSSSTTGTNAFSTVVLSSFGYTQGSQSAYPAQYTITLSFDPTIFSNKQKINLTVPNLVTTRSIIGQPTRLFQKSASAVTSGGQ